MVPENPEFNESVQHLLLRYMISDGESFVRSQNILNEQFFDEKLQKVAKYILTYFNDFKNTPIPEQIKAYTGFDLVPMEPNQVTPENTNWYLSTVEKFCRYKALESAILDGFDLLNSGRGNEVEALVKEAMTISLQTDLGTEYFEDPEIRLLKLKNRDGFVSTGWKGLDKKLYGGFTRGALNVFCGGSGAGKSLFLQNIALNWAFMGLNVVYFSLELSEELISMRLDAMVANMSTSEVIKDIGKAALLVKKAGEDAGHLTVKRIKNGSTANELRAYMREYKIKTGRKVDAIVVDYLDLLFPNNKKINPSDMFIKDKYTSEELRDLAFEEDVLCASASQLNRGAVDSREFDHSHIAGGISKINTADNVFAILATNAMKEAGDMELQFLKTRSSSAVGQSIKLRYDAVTMRITDDDMFVEHDEPQPQRPAPPPKDRAAPSQDKGGTSEAPSPSSADKKRNDMLSMVAKIQNRGRLSDL